MGEILKLLIVYDHALFRDALRSILENEPGLSVVGDIQDGEKAIEMIRALGPDVVLLAIKSPVGDGLEATRKIRHEFPSVKVLMITGALNDEEMVYQAFRAGTNGYIYKTESKERLVEAIYGVMLGQLTAFSSPAIDILLARVSGSDEEPSVVLPGRSRLTARESEVLGLVAEGLSNKEIADRLELSASTVRNHISAILVKLGVHKRVQAALYAVKHRGADLGRRSASSVI